MNLTEGGQEKAKKPSAMGVAEDGRGQAERIAWEAKEKAQREVASSLAELPWVNQE